MYHTFHMNPWSYLLALPIGISIYLLIYFIGKIINILILISILLFTKNKIKK